MTYHNFKRVNAGGRASVEEIKKTTQVVAQSRNTSKSLAQTESVTLAKSNVIKSKEDVTNFEKR